ncbi:hypothetical protein MHZ92_18200 [Sporosarcina sp. ACRSL]|uniref:hypothetical protein n=1 Tax=Sporosarcina sp. ACRSL TaxID=2918215 RepID=UPI001EF423FB|nr:hypothetical protein [Sporosarcina sp. ACRSL]MCG7346049.1 hypothetical protein [Sporosarcina sp. ACRSL]
MEWRSATPAGTARAEDPGLSESRNEERLLRPKAKRWEHLLSISAKTAEIDKSNPALFDWLKPCPRKASDRSGNQWYLQQARIIRTNSQTFYSDILRENKNVQVD